MHLNDDDVLLSGNNNLWNNFLLGMVVFTMLSLFAVSNSAVLSISVTQSMCIPFVVTLRYIPLVKGTYFFKAFV